MIWFFVKVWNIVIDLFHDNKYYSSCFSNFYTRYAPQLVCVYLVHVNKGHIYIENGNMIVFSTVESHKVRNKRYRQNKNTPNFVTSIIGKRQHFSFTFLWCNINWLYLCNTIIAILDHHGEVKNGIVELIN